LRSPPRWTKWSRGVRTRGLRVGAVGGPRPFYFRSTDFAPSLLTCFSIRVQFEPIKFENEQLKAGVLHRHFAGRAHASFKASTEEILALVVQSRKRSGVRSKSVFRIEATFLVAGNVFDRRRLFFDTWLSTRYCIPRGWRAFSYRDAGSGSTNSLRRTANVPSCCGRKPSWRRLHLDARELAFPVERKIVRSRAARLRRHQLHNYHNTLGCGRYRTYSR